MGVRKDTRQLCGSLWCDINAVCLSNSSCVCPSTMRGDPVRSLCECDEGRVMVGSSCVVPPTEAPTHSAEIPTHSSETFTTETCDALWAWILIGCVCAFAAGALVGIWYGTHFCAETKVHPVTRRLQNPVYEATSTTQRTSP